LKNIFLEFMASSHEKQEALIPVISVMLEFNSQEIGKLRKRFPSLTPTTRTSETSPRTHETVVSNLSQVR